MAKCNFNIGFNQSIDELIEKAKRGIISIGGMFDGDIQKGSFSIPTQVGKITGSYYVKNNSITFEILEKPILITCKKIEDELGKYLGTATQELFKFDSVNVGFLHIKKPIKLSEIQLINPTDIQVSQLVTASVTLYVEDSEAWGSNETWRGTKTNAVTLSNAHLPQQFMEFVVKMGGEIRVELYFTAQIINPNGDVVVDGEFKLFEGTSEDNNDLDGQRTFQILVNNNSQSSYTSRVNNDDEGGDFATASITISNSQMKTE